MEVLNTGRILGSQNRDRTGAENAKRFEAFKIGLNPAPPLLSDPAIDDFHRFPLNGLLSYCRGNQIIFVVYFCQLVGMYKP